MAMLRSSKPRAAVCRLGGIGDCLVAGSVLPLLAKDHLVDVIATDPNHAIFENNPFADRIIKVRREDMPDTPLEWQMWFVRRSHEYDKFVNLSHSMETTLALMPDQTQFWWPDNPRRQLCNVNYLERTHDIADVPHIFDPGPRFYPTEDELATDAEDNEKCGPIVVGWCLSGSRIDKSWPQSAVAIARVLRETGASVCLFGTRAKSAEAAEQVARQVALQNGTLRGLHMTMSTDPDTKDRPIRQVLTRAHACTVMVGPDTGIMWSVAMLDKPKIVLLSHAAPENITRHWRNTVTLHADKNRIPCWPCHRLHDDFSTCMQNEAKTGAACISSISTETVVRAVKAALDTTP